MRSYPRTIFKDGKSIRVNNETEEINKAAEGYESHWKPEIIEKRKGTDRAILRGTVLEIEEIVEAEDAEYNRVDPVTNEVVIPEEVKPKASKRVRRTKAQIEADKKNGNSTR